MTTSWTGKTLTWNNKPAGAEKCDEIAVPQRTAAGVLDKYVFDVALFVAKWYNGTPRTGFVLTYANEATADLNSLYSSDCGIAGNLPLLSISYATRESIPNGVYYIRNHNSGKYIDVIGQSTESAKTIHQWNFHGGPSQQWKITHVGNNWYTIRPQHAPNMAMDVYNNSAGNGAKVQQFTYHGRDNQQFGFYKQSNDGTYRIVTKSSLGTRNLSVQSASTANGAIIHQYGYGGANDFWWLEKANAIGGAKAYRQVNNININCLGYALERNDCPKLTMSYNESVHSVYNRLESLIRTTMNRSCRKLSSKDDLIHPTKEYKIAMRVGPMDYHFMVQTNTGGWAHKQGGCNSRNAGMINPSTFDWKQPTVVDSNYNVVAEKSYYNSETIYFAVTR